MKICLLLAALHLSAICSGQTFFSFNAPCATAYQHLLSLRIKPGLQILQQEKRDNPNNLVPYFLENYADFMELFFNEDPAQYKLRKPSKARRLEQMAAGPDQSPLRLFSQAVIHLQWAAIEMKFNNRWNGALDFRDAFQLANENSRRFPQFSPNGMITGPMQMVAATIPKGFQWLSSMMGIKGNMVAGEAQIKQFLNSNDSWARLFFAEGVFYHTYLQFHLLNQPDEALAFVRQKNLDVVNNHLFTYMVANLYLNNKQSAFTQTTVLSRSQTSDYLNTPVWDFEMAYARLYHLEADAGQYFERFLSRFKGSYYVKDAWLKLGWHYLLQGNQAKYRYCLEQVRKKGHTGSDADKRAQKEAEQGRIPNLLLLKTRLLSDGGYPQEALQLLAGKTQADFTDAVDRIEFLYRSGRLMEDLNQPNRALPYYNQTIQNGRQRTEYFAARAALQAGLIMESQGNRKQAIAYFRTCIDMEDHDYENALEQKAKAGLERLGVKG